MSKVRSKKINWLAWFVVYLFMTKVFVWYDKFSEFDSLWDTFVHSFIFRDSFIIVFVLSLALITAIIDDWNTPFRQFSERHRWGIYYIVVYVVCGFFYMAHNWVLSHFFQSPFGTWKSLLIQWTILYAITMLASYIKFFMMSKKKSEEKKITQVNKLQKVRLKTGEEAVVVEILNDGKGYRVKVPQGDAYYSQREISSSDIKSVFESIETTFTTIV